MKNLKSFLSGKVTLAFCILLGVVAIGLTLVFNLNAQKPEEPGLPEPLPLQSRVVFAGDIFKDDIVGVGRVATDEETLDLAAGLEDDPNLPGDVVSRIEDYITRRPDSPYNASLRHQLGKFYEKTGRFSKAAAHWEEAFLASVGQTDGFGKDVADQALARLAYLRASFGHVQDFELLTAGFKDRVFDHGGPATYLWLRAHEKYGRMKHNPQAAFRCGIFALDHVGQALGNTYDRQGLLNTEGKEEGFTLNELRALADAYGLDMEAVAREGRDDLVIPSIVHLQLNHYAAIVKEVEGLFKVVDPTNGGVRWLTSQEINEECSGYFLIPVEGLDRGWRPVDIEEGNLVFGRGSSRPPQDQECPPPCETCPCPPGNPPATTPEAAPGSSPGSTPGAPNNPGAPSDPDCDDCAKLTAEGMATWSIAEPYVNLWIRDVPLFYQPAKGPAIRLFLGHRQRGGDDQDYYDDTSFGTGWHSNWRAAAGHFGGQTHVVYQPFGRLGYYEFDSSSDNQSDPLHADNSVLHKIKSGAATVGYKLEMPDGTEYVFDHQNYDGDYYITEWIDPQGDKLTFSQDGSDLLDKITDADGNDTTFAYDDAYDSTLVTKVTAPGSRVVELDYNSSGELTDITDVEDIVSSFSYDSYGRIDELTTPYGDTTFEYNASIAEEYDRWIKVTDPEGLIQAVVLVDDNAASMPSTFNSSVIPQNTVLDTLDTANRNDRNTFFWNPQQWASLSTTTISNFTWNQYKQARIRHWLWENLSHVDTLSLEQAPSPDGTQEGQITWYDYDGKTSDHIIGTQVMPGEIARRLPNGDTWYVRTVRNSKGNVTSETSTYTATSGSNSTRTRSFTYSSDGIDLKTEKDYDSNTVREWTYNSKHQVLTAKEHPKSGVIYTTTYTYNSDNQVATITTPAGLLSTYTYDSDDRLQKIVDSIGGTNLRTNQFTWQDGNLHKFTDARGFVRTNTYDKLNRITKIEYGDSTYEEFRYTDDGTASGKLWLDMTYFRDRRGKAWEYEFNGIRQKTKSTDPLNNATEYGYCNCGGLTTFTNALDEVTTLDYDYQGHRTAITYENDDTIDFGYNELGQLIGITNALGKRTLEYNLQGLLVKVKNDDGDVERQITYDKNDRPLWVTDANGVTVTNTFDWLGRVTKRKYPGGGEEEFTYSEKGLTTYEDQLNKDTTYTYDAALRMTSTTTPNNETVDYTYSPADDLLTMEDDRSKTTTWTYDDEGRVATKKYQGQSFDNAAYDYDATGNLTSRKLYTTSSAFKETEYEYDAAGNLTKIDYPSGTTDITYEYDGLNRVDKMVDAAGTTEFTYTDSGQLATENGPWSYDLVTYDYNTSRLRSSLTVQQASGKNWTQDYTYDDSGRLTDIDVPKLSSSDFTYSYSGHSNLEDATRIFRQLTFPSSAKIVNDYDTLARLTSTQLKTSANVLTNKHDYVYNDRHQRTKQTFVDSSYISYTYDDLGQLTEADASGGGTDYDYAYDDGWNLD